MKCQLSDIGCSCLWEKTSSRLNSNFVIFNNLVVASFRGDLTGYWQFCFCVRKQRPLSHSYCDQEDLKPRWLSWSSAIHCYRTVQHNRVEVACLPSCCNMTVTAHNAWQPIFSEATWWMAIELSSLIGIPFWANLNPLNLSQYNMQRTVSHSKKIFTVGAIWLDLLLVENYFGLNLQDCFCLKLTFQWIYLATWTGGSVISLVSLYNRCILTIHMYGTVKCCLLARVLWCWCKHYQHLSKQ